MNLAEKFAYMATGQLYLDADLIAARNTATIVTTHLNAITDPIKQAPIFRQLVGSAGQHPFVNPNFRVEFGRNIHVGDQFYANYDCVLLDGAPITIGDRCWLAANVTVLPGVTIGDKTIVGAGSVVTHDLPSNVLAAGNPCQVLRPITAADRTGFTGMSFTE